MAVATTKEWIGFFTECGIPDDVAAIYALSFYKNRIQKSMLMDLNKEYLKDMDITAMGDVIAILKHAKIVHENYTREKVLKGSQKSKTTVKSTLNSSITSVKKPTSVRLLPLEPFAKTTKPSADEMLRKRTELRITNDNNLNKPVSKIVTCEVNKDETNIILTTKSSKNESKGRLRLQDPPISRTQRGLPEDDEGFIVKMPSGISDRPKKLLEKAKVKQKKTVFDRLGESFVSSTTSEVPNAKTDSKEKNSVFSRLGEKTHLVSSTSQADDVIIVAEKGAYSGASKSISSKKKEPLTNAGTMRADCEEPILRLTNSKPVKADSLKARLGANTQKISITSKFTSFSKKKESSSTSTKSNLLLEREKRFQPNSKYSNKGENLYANLVVAPRHAAPASSSSSTSGSRGIKRKQPSPIYEVEERAEGSPSKKVRFGAISLRLIPPKKADLTAANKLKNYPKLTMMIKNDKDMKPNSRPVPKLSSGVQIGLLSSDKISVKPNVRDRIGAKHLAPRIGTEAKKERPLVLKKMKSRIHDRLG